MDQHGGLKGLTLPLANHVLGGKFPEFPVDIGMQNLRKLES
jgi:hypothetical protein